MTDFKTLSDIELVDLLKTNSTTEAFTEIYDRYWPPLLLHAQRMLHDNDLAKDAVQEVFTRLFQLSINLHVASSLSSYLYKAIRFQVLDRIKHDKVKMNYEEDFLKFSENWVIPSDQQICLKELAHAIESEIQKMPPKMREIFELSRKQYLTQREIAKMLDLSENTVNNHIQRAIKKLRENELIRTSSITYILLSYLLNFS